MRFFAVVTALTLAVLLSLAGSVAAKGGKGGGRAKPSGSHGPKFRSQSGGPSASKSQPGKGSAKADKPQLANQANKPSPQDREKLGKKAKDAPSADDGTTGEPTGPNKKEQQLANFQRQRDKKLAQAEHLRQIAEQNGNANLLANADRMEAQALDQYAQKVAHLEKFGVTDPALDGGGVTDPLVAGDQPLFPVGSY
jgi:hypothetical protein